MVMPRGLSLERRPKRLLESLTKTDLPARERIVEIRLKVADPLQIAEASERDTRAA